MFKLGMTSWKTDMDLPFPSPQNGIIGHRGISKNAPENTLAAFRAAKAHGLNWVEFDVQLSKDGELVVIHDDHLDRTTNGKGLVQELTLSALKELDAGKWFDEKYAGEQIPTLDEVLPLLVEEGLHANIEMKIPENSDLAYLQKAAKKLSDIIESHWPKDLPPLSVSSFNHQALFYFRQYLPNHPIGFLVEDFDGDVLQKFDNFQNFTLNCADKALTPDKIALLNDQNIPFMVYTVNDPARGEYLLESGAFAIFSDIPLLIAKPKAS